jgi:hypothetical protein
VLADDFWFGRHPNASERAPGWIQLSGINPLAACFTEQVHGRYSAKLQERTVFLDIKLGSR